MKLKLRPIGNSLGIIIPKDFLKTLGLKEGDEIELTVEGEKIKLVLERN